MLNYSKIAEALGVNNYTDNGKVVFTRRFLLKRGFCCNARPACRNCPYQISEVSASKPNENAILLSQSCDKEHKEF